ncbi:SIS domain-containing protein [Anaerosacchariphilus polymeriproducens]|uniref:SIS domain-containing protein n=1 Tax=Anaerosacchariphilus polymeriproducens TaxID=1812858 RepID=A0A371AWT3_9FIRM|nr:SIS domain-containing protein [Anaerosacchariphilus polymeriproducens]RDU24046.1 SIS domain-containing protein [Anaerosacchariphilus polymeriproducens]
MNAKKTILEILEKHDEIKDVYFLACGGSLVDLYPGFYFIQAESATMHAAWLPAREFTIAPPKHLGKHSLIIACSHGGNTKETVDAVRFAHEKGAAVITLTHNKDSACNDSTMNPIIYDWAEEVDEKEKPQGIVLDLLNELMKAQEPDYKLYDTIAEGLLKIDRIVKAAVKKVQNRTWVFAEKYYKEPFLYIMGSGASFSQAYGFSICSLQEMQWMDCCYLHSGEYFHGPFEVTDEDHLYILLMSKGSNRIMDERALTFLQKYANKYEVIDAEELGIGEIDDSCVDYFNPILFYAMSVEYRKGLQDKRRHPLDMRRYMGVVEY